ncbi:helix-turn-helix transcriptional regulator [Paenibacillus sp. JTLBN-2024]
MPGLQAFIGKRIRQIRTAKDLTQQEVADAAQMEDSYFGGIERGEKNITVSTLEKVIHALDISPVDIFREFETTQTHALRETVIDEFVIFTNQLSDEQLEVLRKINNELKLAFHTK